MAPAPHPRTMRTAFEFCPPTAAKVVPDGPEARRT